MKAFAKRGYRLRDAKLEVRLIYTAFLIFVALGMLTIAAFQLEHIGPGPTDIAAYYRGGERHGEMSFPKTFRELVEVTHFHTFIMGVVYLVLAHLFIATKMPRRMQRFVIVLAWAGLAGDIVAPWLIRYGAAGFAYLQFTSWLAEWGGFGLFVVMPIGEMWFARSRRGPRSGAPALEGAQLSEEGR